MRAGNQSCKPTGFSRGYLTDDHKRPGEYKYGEWEEFEQDNTPVDIGAGMCEKAPENDKAPECDKAPDEEVAE